jgi:hypothetical protein
LAESELAKTFKEPLKDHLNYSVMAGMRAIGPLWLDIGYGISRNELKLGLSWEF